MCEKVRYNVCNVDIDKGIIMTQKNYSFSVLTDDKANVELIDRIRKNCKDTGRTFTWVVLQALKAYDAKQKELANGK